MPGGLILSLLSFVASHLVLLIFVGFVVVGGWLMGLWGKPPAELSRTVTTAVQPRPPTDTPTETGAKSTRVVPDVPSADSAPRTTPGRGTESESDARPRPGPAAGGQQPPLIGGTLPNYAITGDAYFRPPEFASGPERSRPSTRDELVQAARRAFWNGDFDAAEAAYMTAITRFPDDPDLFGELGNLYQSMGRTQRSLDAFYEAAVRLRAQGNRDKLNKVIDLLEAQNYRDATGLRP